MIGVEQAVQISTEYLRKFSNLIPTSDMRLEEFEFNDRKGTWLVTISVLDSNNMGPISLGSRAYKTLEVDSESGTVIGMRMRNPLIKVG